MAITQRSCVASSVVKACLLGMFVSLAGCAMLTSPFDHTSSSSTPVYEGIGNSARDMTQKEKALANSNFSVEVVKLDDMRRPRNLAKDPKEGLIYQYEPDELLGGVTFRLPVLFSKYLAYRPVMPKNYLVELQVKKIHTVIETGTLFQGGSMGRYAVELEISALARRPDSRVVMQKTYTYTDKMARKVYDGRSPSAELDRTRMYDMVEQGVREIAADIGWDLTWDARWWHVAPPPAPTAIERVTPFIAPLPNQTEKPLELMHPQPEEGPEKGLEEGPQVEPENWRQSVSAPSAQPQGLLLPQSSLIQ